MGSPSIQPCFSPRWFVLVYQLPPMPGYLRTKIWRRLQRLGAIPVRSSAYVLPAGEAAREDFHWLVREIVEGGGEAALCEARLVDGMADADVEAQFNAARDENYAAIADEARALLQAAAPTPAVVARLRRRFAQVEAIDFFAAGRGREAARLVRRLEGAGDKREAAAEDAREDLTGRVWVTREHVFVDRIACAWVVKRFVDPDARFKFVPAQGYQPRPGELRFDMFEGEITHQGGCCSMEVLIGRAGLDRDPALAAIAEIVHDIDLKDSKFGREETAGIGHLLTGVCAPGRGDDQRIARSAAIFNDLYDWFAGAHR
jgi:hypothetical protein